VRADLLDVVTTYFNPMRWESRSRLHKAFEQHMLDSGVRLTTVEVAFGDRPWELPDDPRINRVRVRTNSLCWTKESAVNIGISRLPEDWKYVAWIDGDVFFRKPGWAAETVHALQLFHIIQPWEQCYDLGPNDEHIKIHNSFCRQYHKDPITTQKMGKGYTFAHPGYAWAASRSAIDQLGGLIDIGVLGAGDHHMALSLIGKSCISVPGKIHPNYLSSIKRWERRAMQHIRGALGYIPFNIEHRWHGRPKQRQYIDRWQILVRHGFDPVEDIKRNTFGLIELAGNKPRMEHDIYKYFASRNEDSNTID
jgi:hypothetical protein